jgi:hypothetical protein
MKYTKQETGESARMKDAIVRARSMIASSKKRLEQIEKILDEHSTKVPAKTKS